MFEMSLTRDDGETIYVPPDELISISPPFQPALVNLNPYKQIAKRRLTAREWRHNETSWYDQEHVRLTRLRTTQPLWADALRVALYATFAKASEAYDGKLERASKEEFTHRMKSLNGTICIGHSLRGGSQQGVRTT